MIRLVDILNEIVNIPAEGEKVKNNSQTLVPQPGKTSGKPLSQDEMVGMNCNMKFLTLNEILNGKIRQIPYYKEVLNDIMKNDYSWDVTNKVIEYSKFMKQNPSSLKNLPPIIVVNDTLQDGAHRISSIYLLQNYMDKNNPLWSKVKLSVKFCYTKKN